MARQVALLLVIATCAFAIVLQRQSNQTIRVQEGPIMSIDVGFLSRGARNFIWYGPDQKVMKDTSKEYRIVLNANSIQLRIRRVNRYRSGVYALYAEDHDNHTWVNTTVIVEVVPLARFEIVLGVGAEKRNVLLNFTAENETCVQDPNTDLDYASNLDKSECNKTRNITHKHDLINVRDTGKWQFGGCDVTVSRDRENTGWDKCGDIPRKSDSTKQYLLQEALYYNDLDRVHTLLLLGANANGQKGKFMQYWWKLKWPLDRIRSPPMLQWFILQTVKRLEDVWRKGSPYDVSRGICTEIPRVLLETNPKLEARDKWNMTTLHWASIIGNINVCRFLLKAGAQVDALDENNATPLHLTRSVRIAELLLQNGARVDALDKYNRTPLHYAGSAAIAELLLQKGAQVDALDKENLTPLHHAAAGGRYEVAELLLKRGAQVDALDKDKHTPLYFAEKYSRKKVVKLLLQNGA